MALTRFGLGTDGRTDGWTDDLKDNSSEGYKQERFFLARP